MRTAAGGRATILWLTYGLPWPADRGAAVRCFQLLRRVAARHRVMVLALVESPPDPDDVAALSPWCDRVEWVAIPSWPGLGGWRELVRHLSRRHPLATWPYCWRAMESRLRQLLLGEAVDIVQVEHSFLAPYVEALPRSPRTILSFHNFAETQYRSMRNMQTRPMEHLAWLAKALCMRGWEARLGARFDRCLAVSPLEAERLATAMGRPVALVPNGVDTASLRPLPPRPGSRLLFVGNLHYPPNRDAVRFLVHGILPLVLREVPEALLSVVGERPPGMLADCERHAVVFIGRAVDAVPRYQEAQVVLAPLRAGGGTRLKILEAMALGRPVVATSVGCEGLRVTAGEHLLVAERAEDLAAAIVRLLRDPVLAERLTEAARRRVEAEYDWELIGRQLFAVYDELLAV